MHQIFSKLRTLNHLRTRAHTYIMVNMMSRKLKLREICMIKNVLGFVHLWRKRAQSMTDYNPHWHAHHSTLCASLIILFIPFALFERIVHFYVSGWAWFRIELNQESMKFLFFIFLNNEIIGSICNYGIESELHRKILVWFVFFP